MKLPFQIETDKKFDEVWSNLIDLFAQKGLPIKIIDKSSGLIISENGELTYTIELDNGKLKNKDAFIVVPKIYNPGSRKIYPINSYMQSSEPIYGEWNIRIKTVDNKTMINVNIVNVFYSYYLGAHIYKQPLTDYKSTGVFENLIAQTIK